MCSCAIVTSQSHYRLQQLYDHKEGLFCKEVVKRSQSGPQWSLTCDHFSRKQIAVTALKTSLQPKICHPQVNGHCFGHMEVIGVCGFFGPKLSQVTGALITQYTFIMLTSARDCLSMRIRVLLLCYFIYHR